MLEPEDVVLRLPMRNSLSDGERAGGRGFETGLFRLKGNVPCGAELGGIAVGHV